MPELADIGAVASNNMGGTGRIFHLAKVEDVDWTAVGIAIPPDPDAATVAERTAWTGNIIFKAGKGFAEVAGTYDKGGSTAESQGETDGKSFKVKIPIHVAGVKADNLDFVNSQRHSNFVLVYTDKEGITYMHGTKMNPVKIGDGTSLSFGENAEAKKGSVLAFEVNSNYAHAIYAGAIDLIPSASGSASASTSGSGSASIS